MFFGESFWVKLLYKDIRMTFQLLSNVKPNFMINGAQINSICYLWATFFKHKIPFIHIFLRISCHVHKSPPHIHLFLWNKIERKVFMQNWWVEQEEEGVQDFYLCEVRFTSRHSFSFFFFAGYERYGKRKGLEEKRTWKAGVL